MPCPSDREPRTEANVQWRNDSRTVRTVVPLAYYPATLAELVRVLQAAEPRLDDSGGVISSGFRLKVTGSGWSFEDLCVSDGRLIDIGALNRSLDYVLGNRQLLVDDRERLAHVEAGVVLFDLNRRLESQDLAMRTLGGSQGQTLAGAMSTGTHGGYLDEPPIADLVRAVHLVTTGGEEIWIESASRPLTVGDDALRRAFANAPADRRPCNDIRIVRNDDALRAVTVGLGRFGVIYAMVVTVRNAFRLAEHTHILEWPAVRAALAQEVGRDFGDRPLGRVDDLLADPPDSLDIAGAPVHLEINFATRKTGRCWVMRRWVTSGGDRNMDGGSNPLCHDGMAELLLNVAASALDAYATVVMLIPIYGAIKATEIGIRAMELRTMMTHHLSTGDALAAALNAVWASQIGEELKWLVNELNDVIMGQQFGRSVGEDEWPNIPSIDFPETVGRIGPSWQITSGNSAESGSSCFRGNSVEMVFDMANDGFLRFMDTILAVAPSFLQAGYISMRFSRRSDALLSMHNVSHPLGVAVEVASLFGLADNDRWLRFVELTGVTQGGRPHWGQQHTLRSSDVARLYGLDRLGRWRSQLYGIAGLSPTFSNNFTRTRGLEPVRLSRQVTAVRRRDGRVTELCNAREAWSPVSVENAITEVLTGLAEYFLFPAGNVTVDVRRTLSTAPDESAANNLDALPALAGTALPEPSAARVERQVTHVRRSGGQISHVCNEGEGWCVAIPVAYEDIDAKRFTYYIETPGDNGNAVRNPLYTREVSPRGTLATRLLVRRYLATDADEDPSNNLGALPVLKTFTPGAPPSGAERAVEAVLRADGGGRVTHLCNATEGWSVSMEQAYDEVRGGVASYFVGSANALLPRAYLTTRPDLAPDNNLEALPPCAERS